MKTLLAFCFLFLTAISSVAANQDAIAPGDTVIGRSDAPLTLVEYSSLSCFHCADFHKTELPVIIKKYIDTGKIRLIFRHHPLDQPSFVAALVVVSFPPEKRFDILTKLFNNQDKWLGTEDGDKVIAQLIGKSVDDINAIINDKELQKIVLEQRLQAQKDYKVEATPTFFFAGNMIEGAPTIEQFVATINPILAKLTGEEQTKVEASQGTSASRAENASQNNKANL